MMMVKAPAKINLSLDVLHKRPDGFHEVEMVMTTVDLADRIELKETKGTRIRIISHDRFVPSDHRNLAYKAADKLQRKYNVKKGVDITIHKQIPVAAGLAGGSSDAAGTLKGLNELWALNLSADELAEVGSEIGSDVAFCIYGGTALATGRGEQIQELPAPPKCWVVLAKPSIGVSTADIYQNLKLDQVDHPDTAKMVQAIEEGDYQGVCENLGNALESVTLQLYPEVKQIKDQMQRFGADAVLMSGSGPTVFGLVQYESKVHRVVNGLRGFCDQVFAVRILGSRAPLA